MSTIDLKGAFTKDRAFHGMDQNHYRYGIHDDGGQTTFIRVKYELADGADFASSSFNPLDDLLPVSVEAFDFTADTWKSRPGLMRKITSLEHTFSENPADVLNELEKARKSFAATTTDADKPGATPV